MVAAAARQGLECLWVGRHGSGSYGELVRAALAGEGIEVELRPSADDAGDTGVCFVLLEPDGERTFVTCAGVDAELTGGRPCVSSRSTPTTWSTSPATTWPTRSAGRH